MSAAKQYVEAIPIGLKSEPSLSEKWIQELIVKNPAILGLGDDLVAIDVERRQYGGGRLDILLSDQDVNRYEVEIQLGKTDESHIIRTLEYWALEKRRDPDLRHCAVIIAEDITSRFYNVINLFNGHIPLIAIKMSAFDVGGNLTVSFTKVLDERRTLRDDKPAEEYAEVTRATWEVNTSKEQVLALEKLALSLRKVVGDFEIKYNKYHVGCVVGGKATNFVCFKPQKNYFRIDLCVQLEANQIAALEEAKIEVLPYTHHWRVHPIRLSKDQLQNPPAAFFDIVKFCFEDYFRK